MEHIKRAWYIAKLCQNAAVTDPLANYTLLDYGFELIDSYVKWFDTEQVPQGTKYIDNTVMEHSDNEYVEEEDELTDDEGSKDVDSDGDGDDDDDDNDDDMDDQGSGFELTDCKLQFILKFSWINFPYFSLNPWFKILL